MKRNLLLSLIFILVLVFCGGASSNLVLANELTGYEQEAVDLLNKDRAAQGLPPLKVDMKLVQLGRDYAADMIRRNFFAHVNPDGQSPFDRMREAGIRYRAAGENIAINYSVEAAQAAFMQSPGHRANILNKNFTHVGIGAVIKSDGTLYLVQEFVAFGNTNPNLPRRVHRSGGGLIIARSIGF